MFSLDLKLHLLGVRRVLLGVHAVLGSRVSGRRKFTSTEFFDTLISYWGLVEMKVSLSSSTGCLGCQW